MNNKTLFFSSKQIAALAVVAFLCYGAQQSFAAPPGCDKKVFDVIRKQAEAKVAYDVAAVDQTLTTPPSALEMTCFGKAISASNEKSSQIFSGDLLKNAKSKAKETFENAIRGHLKNFQKEGEPESEAVGLNGNPGASLGTTSPYKCEGLKKASEKMNEPLVELPAFDELASTDGSAIDTVDKDKAKDFLKSWNASSDQNVAKDAKESKDQMKQNDNVIGFAGNETPCQVLLDSGLNVSCEGEVSNTNVSSTASTGTVANTTNSGTPGVDPSVNKSFSAKKALKKVFDKVESEVAVIKKPVSIAALTCFNKAVESFAKGSAKLHSGDFSRQVKEPVEEGLKSHFSDYEWEDLNKLIAYDADIQASFEVKVVLEAQVTTADSFTGPTIKNFSCDNTNKAWVADRDEELKETPSFGEMLTMAKDGVVDGASDLTKKMVDDFKKSTSSFQTGIEDMEDRKNVVLAVDNPLAKNATVCGALIDTLGLTTDCNSANDSRYK